MVEHFPLSGSSCVQSQARHVREVGAKEQPVYGGWRYDMNIYLFLKIVLPRQKGCCLVKKGYLNPYPYHHGY